MKEAIRIKNFLGIQDIELDLKRINIIIGPQASGKSICAKLVYYFRNFFLVVLSGIENGQGKREIDIHFKKIFEEYFPASMWGKDNFFIEYQVDQNFIKISRKDIDKKSLNLVYSDSYKKKIASLKKIYLSCVKSDIKINGEFRYTYDEIRVAREKMNEHILQSFPKEVVYYQVFVPAGRSFFSNLQNNIFSFLSSNNSIDPFLKMFGSVYENMKDFYAFITHEKIFTSSNEYSVWKKLSNEILCGQFVIDSGDEFIRISDHRKIEIQNSSSGQQEILPLLVMLSSLPFINFRNESGKIIYIEEPEAHLFPSSQKSIIEMISLAIGFRGEKSGVFLTTHSPYILSSINNLLLAGLGYEDPKKLKEITKIIPEFLTIERDDIAVYSISEGKIKNLIDHETGLIDLNIIDNVSNEISDQFDKILNLV